MDSVKIAEMVGLIVLSYLLGSLPFGFWIGKRKMGAAFDIRNFGSGSIGFTNVLRVLGAGTAIPVLLADSLKGYLPTALAGWLHMGVTAAWLCLIAVMIGHAFSLYFRITEKHFSGGKSVASALGGILALQPAIAGWSLLLFGTVLLFTRRMSVASMLGALCTFVLTFRLHIGLGGGISFGFGLGLGWHIFFGLVFVLIAVFHRRNIGRLIHGVEPALFEWSDIAKACRRTINRLIGRPVDDRKDNELIVCAFVVHAMNWQDLLQTVLSWGIWLLGCWPQTRMLAIKILACMPVLERAEIRNIMLRDGRRVRILIPAIAWTSEMIKMVRYAYEINQKEGRIPDGPEGQTARDEIKKIKSTLEYRRSEWFRQRLWQRLISTAVQVRRQGAEYLGLGALLSTEFNGGSDLQEWCDKYGLGLTIDNGAAYTAVSTVEALVKVCPLPLDEAKIAVVGASGFIGRITAKYLQEVAGSVTAIGREEAKLDGFDKSTVISTALTAAEGSDIVVLLTSSPIPIITLANCQAFKPGTIFLDGARPSNFDDAILDDYPEMNFQVVRCGVIEFPTEPGKQLMCGVDFHFDGYYPACTAQLVSTAAGGEEGKKHASRGARVSRADFDYHAIRGPALGFRVITSKKSEGDVFEGMYN